jgi:hypothetical protein
MKIRGMQLPAFASAYAAGWSSIPRPRYVFLCIADHYEPDWGGASRQTQQERVKRWTTSYPKVFGDLEDSRGRPPQHSFFYPIECYDASHLDQLAQLAKAGWGDVEVHLHHDDDNADSLRELLMRSTALFQERHGLLRKDPEGVIRYGFIHGNWALDNSHPDGRWCGVNNEITVLKETGCYADYTMPAAPHPAQTKTINAIYYAIDDPIRAKSHDTGIAARVGVSPPDDGLLMIQGPLVISHRRLLRKPRIENGNVSNSQPLSAMRIANWLRARVTIAGNPDWQFIKLHTHGAPELNADTWFGESTIQFHQQLREYSNRLGFQYFYVTAFEMAELVKQAENGRQVPRFACST